MREEREFRQVLSICPHDIARRPGWKWGVIPRECRDASVLALSHRPSCAATDSLVPLREKERERVVRPRASLRIEYTLAGYNFFTSSHFLRNLRLSVITSLVREIAFNRLHASGTGNQLSAFIFWSFNAGGKKWWWFRCVVVVHLAGADPESNAFLWRHSGDSQDPSPLGDVGKSRSVLLHPRTRVQSQGVCGANGGDIHF